MDIVEGDWIVVGDKEYAIKSCAEWDTSIQNVQSRAFRRMAVKDCYTKRSPAISGGKRGVSVTNLDGLKCTPLDPVSPDIQRRVALDAPMELLQTFVTDGDGFVHLVIEDIKNPNL